MPTWNDIINELGSKPNYLDVVRRRFLKQLSNYTKRNVIIYYSAWLEKAGINVDFGINDSDKTGFMSAISKLDEKKGLDLILHTPGGEIGATEHLVEYLKNVFNNDIRVVVPQIAMSAGTMISLASKEILMGSYSNLGPIDPQIKGLPTHGILEEYERAKKEIKEDPSTIPIWQVALNKYPPSLIGDCKKAIAWSEEIARKWLKEGMFKEDKSAKIKIEKIIEGLSDYKLIKSHSKHISLRKAQNLGLKIFDLRKDKQLQDKILSVHHSTIITLAQSSAYKVIENQNGKAFIQFIQQVAK